MAISCVVFGFFVFRLSSSFTLFALLWDEWLARKTLTRVLIDD